MNKNLLIFGGVLNSLKCIFHVMFWKLYGWPGTLMCLGYDDIARMQVLTVQWTMVYALFAYASFFHHKSMLSSSLGRGLAWFIILSNVARITNQLVFWDAFWSKSIVIISICFLMILSYLVPLISTRNVSTK